MFDNNLIYESGSIPGKGIYQCIVCGTEIEIEEGEILPICPKCETEQFFKIA